MSTQCSTCKRELPCDSKFKRCEPCREKERMHDARTRANKQARYEALENKANTCDACFAEKPDEDFAAVNHNQPFRSKRCSACRAKQNKYLKTCDQDNRRAKARIVDRQPKRREQHNTWVQANREKVAIAWMSYRTRKREQDIDSYRAENRERLRIYREQNPDRFRQYQQNNLNNMTRTFARYKWEAMNRGLNFDIDEATGIRLLQTTCTYCTQSNPSRNHGGLDRVNNDRGYSIDNVVPCCKICNRMKNCQDVNTFFNCTEHILVFNEYIEGSLYPESFADSTRSLDIFSVYQQSAAQRVLEFKLTRDNVIDLCSSDCYLCGKQTTHKGHINGIDRIDNDVGYILSNAAPCCRTCNFKKFDLSNEVFLAHLDQIYENKERALSTIREICGNVEFTTQIQMMVPSTTKLTKQTIAETSEERRKIREQKVCESYSDENIAIRAVALVNKMVI